MATMENLQNERTGRHLCLSGLRQRGPEWRAGQVPDLRYRWKQVHGNQVNGTPRPPLPEVGMPAAVQRERGCD